MIKVIGKKTFIFIILAVLALSIFTVSSLPINADNSDKFTVVIDAGHGGRDAGASSKSGTKESDLNLDIAFLLGKELETRGLKVAYTRKNKDGLYNLLDRNKKLSDLNRRKKIIEEENADLVVSIHQNTYPDSAVSGPQVFYHGGAEISKKFADSIQTQFNQNLGYKKLARSGDYYIVRETNASAVIVECGFLTNYQDEQRLKTLEYQQKLAYYIAVGIVSQLETSFSGTHYM